MSIDKIQNSADCFEREPDMMSVRSARAEIRALVEPVTESVTVALRDALGRVLAESVRSPIDVPTHTNSAMDGFAVRRADLDGTPPPTLRQIGAAFAGHPYAGEIQAGQCVRIMTGAAIPRGADTVVMQEHTEAHGDDITFSEVPRHGANVRPAGEDIARGQIAMTPGTVITPAALGLLASLGRSELRVWRPLRVAFFSTGDELRPLGSVLSRGQIFDSNRYTVYGMLKRLGVEIFDLGLVADEPQALRTILRQAASIADVIISTGGVSVGEADFVRSVLAEVGRVNFWKIAMKPGRPLAFGNVGDARFFGLPGNPVAVMVTFYQFVQPVLRYMRGEHEHAPELMLRARCLTPLRKKTGRTEYVRALLAEESGDWTVRRTGPQGSGILNSMVRANCFIVLADQQGNVAAGEWVDVQPLAGLI